MHLMGIVFLGIGVGIGWLFCTLFQTNGSFPFPVYLIAAILTLAFCFTGLYMLFGPLIAAWRKKRMMATGDCIVARITEIAQPPYGNGAWYIYAAATDPVTGEATTYRSRLYYADPTPQLIEHNVNVYVHPTRRKRYVMDEQSAMRTPQH